MDGRPGDDYEEVLRFAARLGEILGLPVETIDERLTTVQAERSLLEAGLSRRKRKERVDQVAALLILQGWLDREANRRKASAAPGEAPAAP